MSTPTNRYETGDEAFPRPETDTHYGSPGVDLLGYFAGQAMQGLLARGDYLGPKLAEDAVQQAHALIDALNKHTSKT